MLPIQSVLYEMLPRQNVTIQNVTDPKPTKGSWMETNHRFVNGKQQKVREWKPIKSSWIEATKSS